MPAKKKTKKADKVPDIDFSVLRTAIKVGGRMINQIINGVHYGSLEVQHLLFEESDFIIECRVCRNLFRSLPNFIAHKRIYCQEYFMDSIRSRDGFPTVLEEETVVVEPQAPEETNASSQSEESTVNKLINGEFQSSNPAYNFYTDMAQRIESQKMNKTVLSMKLSKIPTNPNAVMVSMGTEQNELEDIAPEVQVVPSPCPLSPEKMDSAILDDVEGMSTPPKSYTDSNRSGNDEICLRRTARVILKRNKDIESSDDKKNENQKSKTANNAAEAKTSVLSSFSPRKSDKSEAPRPVELRKQSTLLTRVKADGLLKFCDLKSLECLQCKLKYASKKSLLHHLQAKHSGKRMQHPCIYCKKQFSYFWGLTRHLISCHNKTRNQVDKMRKKLWQHVHSVNERGDKTSAPSRSPLKGSSSKSDVKIASPGKSLPSSPVKTVKKPQATTKAPVLSIVDQLQDRIKLLGDSKSRPMEFHRCPSCGKAFWKNSNYESHVKVCGMMSTPKQGAEGKTGVECVRRKLDQFCKSEKHNNPNNEKRNDMHHRDEDLESVEHGMEDSILIEDDDSVKSTKSEASHEQQCISSGEDSPRVKEEKDNMFDSIDLEDAFSVEEVMCDEKDEEFSEKRELTPEEEMLLVEEIWVNKQPGKPPEKVKSNRIYVVEPKTSKPFSHCQDSKKINQLVDEVNLRCLECNMEFSSVSNVRRHVVRHLGWKRYKCKMCKFMSYNKSECNTHLYRTHSDRTRGFKANTFIVDLNKEASRLRNMKKQQTLSGKQAVEKTDHFGRSMKYRYSSRYRSRSVSKASEDRRKPGVREENIKGPDMNRFNISTRNSTREFDTRPYQVVDRMSTLFTRKGYYPKTESTKNRGNSSVKGSETEDDAMSTVSHTSTRSTRSRASDSKFHSPSKVRIQGVPEGTFMIKSTTEPTFLNRNIFESFKDDQMDPTGFLSKLDSSQLKEVEDSDLILRTSGENVDPISVQEIEIQDANHEGGEQFEEISENFSNPIQPSDDGLEFGSSDCVQGETVSAGHRTGPNVDDGSVEEGPYLIERPEFSNTCKFPKWSARRYRNQLNQDSNESIASSGNSDIVQNFITVSKSDDDLLVIAKESSKSEKVAEGELVKPDLVKKSRRIAAIKSAQDSVSREPEKLPLRSKRVSPKTAKLIEMKRLSLPSKRSASPGRKGSGSVKQRKSLGAHGSRSTHWSGAVKSKVDWAKCTSIKQSACWRKGAPFASRFVTKTVTVTGKTDSVEPSNSGQ